MARFTGEVETRLQNHLDKRTPDTQGLILIPARDVRQAVHAILALKDFRRYVIQKGAESMEREAEAAEKEKRG